MFRLRQINTSFHLYRRNDWKIVWLELWTQLQCQLGTRTNKREKKEGEEVNWVILYLGADFNNQVFSRFKQVACFWELVDSDVNFCSVLWFEPGGSMWVDSDDDFHSGCRNVGHHYRQQSFSGLRSLERSDYTITLLGLVFVIPLVLVCRRFNEN